MKLTKSNIDKLQFSGKPVDYYDTELKGFGIRVGGESKSFFARKELNGKPARITIGKLGAWTPDLAREEAKSLLRMMDTGIDPRETAKRSKEALRTARDCFKAYLAKPGLKATSISNYTKAQNLYLVTWLDRPLVSITRADVLALHQKITAGAGPSAATLAMSTFRAMWNYSHLHLEDPPNCPTKVLTAAAAWAPSKRRKDRLLPADFPRFIEALNSKRIRHTRRDGFTLVLHTGARSEEIAGLLWENVDMVKWIFMVPDTKNGSDLLLPISVPLRAMFERRKALKEPSPYVFMGRGRGKDGERTDVTLEAETLHRIGFPGLSVHGLRRTFRSLCESLAFPAAITKVLMNHSLDTDITDSYFDAPAEVLRPYSERISAEIERLAVL
jgi:integrase